MIRANIQDDTAKRVSEITKKPLTKGFDSQVNALCDKIESNNEKENTGVKKLDCLCPETTGVLE
ncbi:MAG: hypothetical protein IH841_09180 [Thaumarchaeota archaeon]|nr:hypothetical protein [Nitrososphaerota archaeon]